MNKETFLQRLACSVMVCLLYSGCEKTEETPVTNTENHPAVAAASQPAPDTVPIPAQFDIGNKRYLFDVSDHSLEELQSLLKRAQEISQFDKSNYDELEIVMILHGPDIDWFTEKNREQNQELIDLAAKLDAFDIIDMKVCEMAMDSRGVTREELPSFIEPVPYAPDEMKRLSEAGHINL